MKYDHKKIEKKWQKYWAEHPELTVADDRSAKPKQYILDMFPYPSGDGLHTGHVESYTATDIISRYLRMNGKDVLHPQGWDAFGLPAENFAIKTKIHPAETTKKAIATFKQQMNMMGFSYDWSREVNSSSPEYYKWTQWFFLLLYKNGLAYKAKGKVNWCGSCQTVLANEQAEGGVCDRCGKPVRQKDLEQWYFKITDFVEDSGRTSGLLAGLDKIDWPESTKAGQRNWIGRSEGAQFKMAIEGSDLFMEVFTTRLDTVFGMTFALIAPEHALVQKLKPQITNWAEVEKYIAQAKKKSELQRISEVKDKTGVELKGVKVINPFTKKAIPLFASDFVLAHYGAGAVMAVPAHDERDFDFAKKFDLPIECVVSPNFPIAVGDNLSDAKEKIEELKNKILSGEECSVDDGVLVNSGGYSGLTSEQARKKLTQWLEKEKIGNGTINYKLRDWLVSRQRYWGAPIPIIYCDKCGEVPVPEKDLPVELPSDVDFMPTGESPLAKSKSFQNVRCPKCGGAARRESDTMDTFVCSSWYYLRYADNKNDKEFAGKEMLKKWLPVDLYVGGAEHVVLHLLYARFFTKVLHKLGYIEFDEPFLKMRHQGIILAPDGRKMSKSWGNVINPNDVVAEYGADALRMFEMFMGPLEDMKPWNTKGIVGIKRFLDRTWNFLSVDYTGIFIDSDDRNKWIKGEIDGVTSHETEVLLHKTIKKVSEDIENLKFNTAISQLMVLRNSFYEVGEKEIIPVAGLSNKSFNEPVKGQRIRKSDFEKFLILLAPFAPFMASEMWEKLGHAESIFKQSWPEYDKDLIKDETIQMPVQINGKVRAILTVPADITEAEAKNIALSDNAILKWLEGKEPKKVIFVKGRLVNIVI